MRLKIALGMIVKRLQTGDELLRFIKNAKEYGHRIDSVIVAYSDYLRPEAQQSISEHTELHAININNPEYCIGEFRKRGISKAAADRLLTCPADKRYGLVPYGFNRTIVTVEAMLRGVDVLFFADNDVYPMTLKQSGSVIEWESLDFFGVHLEQLEAGAHITTGDYSGYNILPPARFSDMDALLRGLQKDDMSSFWQSSDSHRCLQLRPDKRQPVPCAKILGGNTAIMLNEFSKLPPFFSSSYIVNDELFLCRGEDTVLGVSIAKTGIICKDIRSFPFHDTYGTLDANMPREPDLRTSPKAQERFYYACTGWIGRNPFYNYLLGNDITAVREFQNEQLRRGAAALAAYTGNPRFNNLPVNFTVSWDSLGRYTYEYERTLEAWYEFIKTLYS